MESTPLYRRLQTSFVIESASSSLASFALIHIRRLYTQFRILQRGKIVKLLGSQNINGTLVFSPSPKNTQWPELQCILHLASLYELAFGNFAYVVNCQIDRITEQCWNLWVIGKTQQFCLAGMYT